MPATFGIHPFLALGVPFRVFAGDFLGGGLGGPGRQRQEAGGSQECVAETHEHKTSEPRGSAPGPGFFYFQPLKPEHAMEAIVNLKERVSRLWGYL